MGLKTTNYKVEKLGITLPVAYAMIRELDIKGEKAIATFVIQTSREDALWRYPIETKKLTFKVNRNGNPYQTAYELAKSQNPVIVKKWNEPDEHKIVNGILYGWQDDIVSG